MLVGSNVNRGNSKHLGKNNADAQVLQQEQQQQRSKKSCDNDNTTLTFPGRLYS
jgi:hypothetical protein